LRRASHFTLISELVAVLVIGLGDLVYSSGSIKEAQMDGFTTGGEF